MIDVSNMQARGTLNRMRTMPDAANWATRLNKTKRQAKK